MEFSPAIYKRLLGFYEDKFDVSRGSEPQGQISDPSQAEILYKGWDFVKKNLSILSDFPLTRVKAFTLNFAKRPFLNYTIYSHPK